MKILMTTDSVGGVWTYSLKLMKALEREGHEFLLITAGTLLTPAQQRQIRELPNVKLIETSFKLEWMQDPWQDVDTMGELLLRLEWEAMPDLVHLNGYAHGALPFRAPRLVVAHSCVYSWWRHVRGGAPGEDYAVYYYRVSKGIQAADHLVAPSASMMKDINSLYGDNGRQSVIPNGQDFSSGPVKKESFVFSMGRAWDDAKNMRALDSAAADINWPVRIAGAVTEPHCGRRHRFHRAETLGPLESAEAQSLLSRAAVYALPAKYEPFGLSVLEAAMSGCALVLGDIPSLRENWDGAAVFADPRRPEEIARRVNGLIADPDSLSNYQALARERSKRFTTGRMAGAYRDLYTNLVTCKPSYEELKN